jgi:nicotinamidase/pyrazinamidase
MRSDLIFWDVDTQVDFMRSEGKLYVPDSEAIIPTLRQLTEHAHTRGIRIVASADEHVAGHRELSDEPDFAETFPEHCMRGTPGQEKIPETSLRHPLVIAPEPLDPGVIGARARSHVGDILFLKHWFDVFTNPNVLPVLDALAPARVVMYGVALDVCKRYAIEGLLRHRPDVRLAIVVDATRAINPETGAELQREWERRGVQTLTARQVLAS